MPATLFRVLDRLKIFDSFHAGPADFARGPGESVDNRRVFDEPGWTPYCVDVERREVVFAHLPASPELADVPFYSITQYQQADAVVAMSFGDAHQLAAALPDPKLLLIFSMGRAGTTLVSHALNGPANVYSVSEPAVFEHRQIRALGGDPDLPALLRDLCRLTFALRGRRDTDTLAVKFKSQALLVAEHFWNAIPDARYVFLYRDAVGWGNSFIQFLDSMGFSAPTDLRERDFHWMMVSADRPLSDLARFIDTDRPPVDAGAILAPGWTIHMEEYARLHTLGMPFLALRYNELMADRQGELERLFDHCGLPHDGIAKALNAFDEDSQKGTQIARRADPKRMTPGEEATFRATLARVPAFADPQTILPDIYRR